MDRVKKYYGEDTAKQILESQWDEIKLSFYKNDVRYQYAAHVKLLASRRDGDNLTVENLSEGAQVEGFGSGYVLYDFSDSRIRRPRVRTGPGLERRPRC